MLSWQPVNGASSYSIEISSDPNFVDPSLTKTYTTKTSSYVVPSPQVATLYYWRARATLAAGVFTEWSDVWTYQIGGLAAPHLMAPADGPFTNVEDVVLDWDPVAGAKTYDLQISTDVNFLTLIQAPTGVTGTSYSPPVTVANDQYYWRVRPLDALGNKLDWSDVPTWTFRRHWPDQPSLEYPANDSTVGDPFYYQWTAVDHASNYTVQLSSSPDFNAFVSCTTVHTTYVPIKGTDCWPGANGTYYWRVIATDAPGTTVDGKPIVTDGIVAQVGRFTYSPESPSPLSPANGETVTVPTLRWSAVAGAASYKVTVTATDGGTGGGSWTTFGTSYTPRAKLSVGKSYRWTVQTVGATSRLGSPLIAGSQPTFTVGDPGVASASLPEPVAPSTGSQWFRFPTLSWTPVASATAYRILVRPVGTIGYTYVPDSFPYPAGEDDGTGWLTAGSYEWKVEAYNGASLIGTSSSSSTLTIKNLTPVGGQRIAITGTALGAAGTSCAIALPERCSDMRQTPVLTWASQPNAGAFKVYLARDEEMTNIVAGYPVTTETNQFTPNTALIDSQAGSAFYWFVQPCKATSGCAPLAHANHAFNKISNPVELDAPTNDAHQQNDVTFSWQDYLATNQKTTGDVTDDTGVNSRIEARQYRIQIATDPNFQTVLETAVVDQTTFTSYINTYPEGTIYWRVQAIDGSLNSLAWSEPQWFLKESPKPALAGPLNGAEVSGSQPFQWHPLNFAGSYDIEVYKDGDTTGSLSKRVVTGNSKQVAFSPITPLPASSTPYTWRVRRVDAKGRPGAWSNLDDPMANFKVVGDPPSPIAPAVNVYVPANDSLFTWDAATGATSYRFERRSAGSSTVTETVNTVSLAWAPTRIIPDGSWQWRVSSFDAAGKVTASSAWQAFKVDATRPTVISKAPTTTALRTANFTAKFSEKVKGVNSSTMKLYLAGRSTPLLATVTLSTDGRTATLNPSANLVAGKFYTVKLSSGIKDLAGNPLVATSWRVQAK